MSITTASPLLRRVRMLVPHVLVLVTLSGCYGSIGRGVATGASGALYERRDTLGMIAGAIHASSDVGIDSICLPGRVVVCIKNE